MTSTKGSLEAIQGTDVSNKTVDVEQTGSFFTGIIGVNISPNEFWNIGLRYENKTFLTVENNTTQDDLGLFPDGRISRNDIPGIIGVGIGYTDNDFFEAQLSFNMYLDKYVSWAANVRDISVWQGIDDSKIRICEIEHNSFDVALGMQFNLSEVFSLSAGSMYQKAGVADNFNSDFRFVTPSYVGVGGGFMWKATDQLTLDFGVSSIFYQDAEVVYEDPHLGSSYDETYGKKALNIAVGLSYSIPY
jgi:long-chain fatty acid transport protein